MNKGPSEELIIANKELLFQNSEKEKRAKELVIANKELAYQNNEKEKRAAELIIANNELAFQNSEKEKRANELAIANRELAFQNSEKENRAQELIIANKELVVQNDEKQKKAEELTRAYDKIKSTEVFLKEYIQGLEEMMFMTHHKVRQPVANILGIAQMLSQFISSPATLKKLIGYMEVSALILDDFTKELTSFIENLEKKGKNNKG
ncbi:diguanylate cyclase [Mucilaginibacter sp.]|uniref:diguanylate cyclase n=1 Tax=Mucilaginibacter sp. TaxID=1882438 RepID=UPI0025D0F02D|nr:diguanylate cyclase [Mucilaginibacter sp.]